VLLGVQQGLCWSMTQTAKLDLILPGERGLIMGLNEFAGYVGVALAGLVTAYAAAWLGPRPGLLGMWLGGLGVALMPLGSGPGAWAAAAALAGFGMALLYPNLSASVADITPPGWRGSAIGIYRF
jgi:MFS family permease